MDGLPASGLVAGDENAEQRQRLRVVVRVSEPPAAVRFFLISYVYACMYVCCRYVRTYVCMYVTQAAPQPGSLFSALLFPGPG